MIEKRREWKKMKKCLRWTDTAFGQTLPVF